MSELEQRIEAARAKKEAADARRARVEEGRAQIEAVELAEREASNAEALAEAEEAHGAIGDELASVETRGGVVIVKRPNALFYNKIGREIGSKSDAKSEDAAKRLIAHCLVHPPRAEYEALVERYPAVPPALITLIVKLAAGGASVAGE